MQESECHSRLSTSIDRAAAILQRGGIIGIPTDTVYGIAANALDEEAVGRVFRLKSREDTSPIPVLIGEIDDLFKYGTDVSDEAVALAEAFWPGQLHDRRIQVRPDSLRRVGWSRHRGSAHFRPPSARPDNFVPGRSNYGDVRQHQRH